MFKVQKARLKKIFITLQIAVTFIYPQSLWAVATPPPTKNYSANVDPIYFPSSVVSNSQSSTNMLENSNIQTLIRNYNSGSAADVFSPLPGGFESGSLQGYGYNEMPSEFACPLFENNPYASIFNALNTIQQSVRITPACAGNNQSFDPNKQIQGNAESLRQSLQQLQLIQTSPAFAQDFSPDQINVVIQNVLGAANNISVQLSNNPIMNSQCGKTSGGQTLLAFNEILNSLAPIALVFAAANPALGAATKMAMMGATMIPSTISQTAQYIKSNTVDITNPEIRNAILQSTCQFMKVNQKINFLRYKEDGNLDEIQKTTNAATSAYRQKYQSVGGLMFDSMSYKYQSELNLAALEKQMAADRAQLNYISKKIIALGTDHERICFAGQSMVQNSKDAVSFPASVNRSIEVGQNLLKENNDPNNFFNNSLNPTGLPINTGSETESGSTASSANSQQVQDLNEYILSLSKSRNRVSAYVDKMVNGSPEESDQAIPLCAAEVKNWVKRITDALNYLGKATNSERAEVDQILSQVPEYKTWTRDYKKLRSERTTSGTVTKVLREMAKPEAVYIRTELAQRANDLKNTLFNRTAGMLSKSPVEAWLQNNIDQYQNAVSQYLHFLRLLQQGISEMSNGTRRSLLGGNARISPLAALLNPSVWEGMATQVDLSQMNLKTFPVKSRQNEIACQHIQTGISKFSQAKDFLGTAQFMCDLIDPVVSDTNPKLVQICRGSPTFNQNIRSTLAQYRAKLTSRGPNGSMKSLADTQKLLKAKATELGCARLLGDLL